MINKGKENASRRRFLQKSLSLIPIAAVGSGIIKTSVSNAEENHAGVSSQYVPIFFNNEEWAFILAATDRLIPGDENGAGAVSEGVPVYIDRQMELPYGYGGLWFMQGPFATAIPEMGYQSNLVPRDIYQRGIKAINFYCRQKFNKSFAEITSEQQESILHNLEQGTSRETVTVRHTTRDAALPYRRMGSFLPGDGVGGAGVHWNGMLWRPLEADLKMRSTVIEKYGEDFIPKDMTVQDYPFSYEEMEPYFDKFEKICGTAGQAGNVQGKIIAGGNPFEAPRQNPFPTKPSLLQRVLPPMKEGGEFGRV